MQKLSFLFVVLVLSATVFVARAEIDKAEVEVRSPDALLEEKNEIHESQRAKMDPLSIAALACHIFSASAKVVGVGLDYLSLVLHSKYLNEIIGTLAAVPEHLESRKASHKKIVDALNTEAASITTSDAEVTSAIASQQSKLAALDATTAARQVEDAADAPKAKAKVEEFAKQMLEMGKLAVETAEKVSKVQTVGVQAPEFLKHVAETTGQSWIGAAPFGFIGPLTSSIGGLITLGKSIAGLKSMRSKCKTTADLILGEIDVFKKDIDWNFCRSYSFMLESFSVVIKHVKAQLQTTPTDAAAKATLTSLGKMVKIIKDGAFATGADFACTSFNTKPATLTDLVPITEMWVDPVAEFDSRMQPAYNKGSPVFTFAVTNQPNVLLNKEVIQTTPVYVDKHPTGGADPVKAKAVYDDLKCKSSGSTGDYSFAPIDSIASKYVPPEHTFLALGAQQKQIDYSMDFTAAGPLAISALQPVVDHRECNRLRDYCVANRKLEGGPCNTKQSSLRDSSAQPGLYTTEQDILYWRNFVAASRNRALVPEAVSPIQKPGLLLLYQRSGYRAPIVDLYTGVDDSRNLASPGVADWWFPIAATLDNDTGGCPAKFVSGWYRKNFYIEPITVEDATLPTVPTATTPTKPAKATKFAARRQQHRSRSKPLHPKRN